MQSDTNGVITYPTWLKVLGHIGEGLDEGVRSHPWCAAHGVRTGADYLSCWIASLIQSPGEPLPYLFLYSPEPSTGKSVFLDALILLLQPGEVASADHAMLSPSGFNGELEGAVLCTIEEIALWRSGAARARLKDWVTGRQLVVHRMYREPKTVPNTTHWIQCANDLRECPLFPGNTRATVIRVAPLGPKGAVPLSELLRSLGDEAPSFLAAMRARDLPTPYGRLGLPSLADGDTRDVPGTSPE